LSFPFTTPPISIGFAGQREKKERKKLKFILCAFITMICELN
jgi:hypothetical protein